MVVIRILQQEFGVKYSLDGVYPGAPGLERPGLFLLGPASAT
jgi:hypothetical protein